jgi:hypothetical protein
MDLLIPPALQPILWALYKQLIQAEQQVPDDQVKNIFKKDRK